MNRIDFIDNLKGFGILCVILGHIANPFSSFIYLWHMPLFFFIGGFFINTNSNNLEFIKKNTKLIKIYIIFGLLGIGTEMIKDVALNRDIETLQLIYGLLFYMDYEHLQNSYALVLWFLPSLFFARIFAFFILKYSKILNIPYIITIILILKYNIKIPFVIDIGIIASIFTIFGYLMFNHIQYFSRNLYIWGGVTIFCYIFVETNIIEYRNFSWADHLVFSLLFCNLLMLIFYKYNHIFKLQYFGFHSIFFYIAHIYTNNIANFILNYIDIKNWLVIFITSIALLVLIKYIINLITQTCKIVNFL